MSLERNQAEVQSVTFKNPVVWADVPDPDVIRVGDYFYMVSTTMFPPGPAAITMPSEIPKRILRGARLATIMV